MGETIYLNRVEEMRRPTSRGVDSNVGKGHETAQAQCTTLSSK